jgi:hypothetical protein
MKCYNYEKIFQCNEFTNFAGISVFVIHNAACDNFEPNVALTSLGRKQVQFCNLVADIASIPLFVEPLLSIRVN